MDILPSIDLRDGKVVRLLRGDYQQQKTYGDDPLEVARQFVQAGARWIHMVDLDAARSGQATNLAHVANVSRSVGAKIQLGGGARSESAIRAMLQAGAHRVVVGSQAVEDWQWFERLVAGGEFAGRLALGLDAREGMLAARGWCNQTDLSAVELARRTRGWQLGAIVYTDIAKDGMLGGVNVQATAEIVQATDVPVIASGGVTSLADVSACRQAGCQGVIIGRAWYEGLIDLRQALELAG